MVGSLKMEVYINWCDVYFCYFCSWTKTS